ncbi:hypothetical protein [Nitrosomonas sp. Is37]|uniref:hypothetical protein n=1 Tax=Nitrosomonas sp. Is37 TaxID=3080535 RepID=UPI00294AB4C8|nr:hypothetical protein [Nitrosomonas sp. Is37]MDV6343276.1 hypothetical protein [Nitrosomonas sp. Is37]
MSGNRLWVEMARIIREVRPGFVFVENSLVITSRELGRVLGNLASMGWVRDGERSELPASERVTIMTFKEDRVCCLAYIFEMSLHVFNDRELKEQPHDALFGRSPREVM